MTLQLQVRARDVPGKLTGELANGTTVLTISDITCTKSFRPAEQENYNRLHTDSGLDWLLVWWVITCFMPGLNFLIITVLTTAEIPFIKKVYELAWSTQTSQNSPCVENAFLHVQSLSVSGFMCVYFLKATCNGGCLEVDQHMSCVRNPNRACLWWHTLTYY